ncbi:MAG: MFS transporter [Novosphingobium sp.]|uniref:MFS transporter n=1 Tax=Novosphingobium sp. TaxID=1874826 RepID=UPI003C7DDDD1
MPPEQAVQELPGGESGPVVTTGYGWAIFALIMGLMLSDYMSRQVLGSVFPLLKVEWALSDEKLGRLGSIIPLVVGLLTFPLSLVADRFGRVRAIIAMALLWSLATLLCGLARNYGEMLAARALIGVGEAAYGSVGLAVIIGAFPARMRAVLTASFMAGGPLGSVIGVALGGTVAASYGWRSPFAIMAIWGVILALGFALIAREKRLAPPLRGERAPLRSVVASPALRLVYLASGLQLFVSGALTAWLPTWFGRVYALPLGKAGQAAAAILLVQALGMIVFGQLSDRLALRSGNQRYQLAIRLALASAILLGSGFLMPAGPLQLALLAAGAFVAAGTTGPVGSIVAQLTHPALLATAFATLTLANNIAGLAPGSWAAGQLADLFDIGIALALCSFAPILAAICFWQARRLALSADR